jgi:hypothetical protein
LTNTTGFPAANLAGTALPSAIVTSSLTALGTVATGVWNGTAIGIGYGGTGQTTKSAAFNALSPITTTGDLIIGNGTNSATRLPIGTNGYVLTVSGGTAVWSASGSGSGTVNSGTQYQLGYYATTGTAISGSSSIVTDASGNLGIGVTPNAWGSGSYAMQLFRGSLWHDGSSYLSMNNNAYYNGTNWIYINSASAYASNYVQVNGEHRWQNAPLGVSGNTVTYTQAMTLTNAGALCIGTTTPTGGCTLNVSSTNSNTISNTYIWNAQDAGLFLRNASSTTNTAVGITMFGGASNNSGAAVLMVQETGNSLGALAFFTGGSGRSSTVPEGMRLDSSGNLLVNSTAPLYTGQHNIRGGVASGTGAFTTQSATTTSYYHTVGTSSGGAFVVYRAGDFAGVYLGWGNSSWTANSDSRLKNVIGTYTNALADIAQIQPVKYTWKADETNTAHVGVIAQSVQNVVPEAMSRSKLPGSEDETEYLGVRYTELIPLMIASIQQLSALVTTQSATITSLTESITALENK